MILLDCEIRDVNKQEERYQIFCSFEQEVFLTIIPQKKSEKKVLYNLQTKGIENNLSVQFLCSEADKNEFEAILSTLGVDIIQPDTIAFNINSESPTGSPIAKYLNLS
eukprot:c14819_g2_i2.p1 GENE.c14819_g2_i2~~c14819_g2_i2.p1  ORF type:complete len:108 (+),score=31.20 c14819_g2_i2:61-384(+)